MVTRIAHFSVDVMFLIRALLQIHLDKSYSCEKGDERAKVYALSEILYTNELTEDEIQTLFRRYAENNNLGNNITLTGEPNQVEEVFEYLFDLPRYKEVHWKNILKGYGPYKFSVIDLRAKKEYETREAEHYATLVNILSRNYAREFDELSQEEKDKFILNNFKLIGRTYEMSWYTPDLPVSWIAEREEIYELTSEAIQHIKQEPASLADDTSD